MVNRLQHIQKYGLQSRPWVWHIIPRTTVDAQLHISRSLRNTGCNISLEASLLLEEFKDGEEKLAIVISRGVLVVGNVGDSHILLAECDGLEHMEVRRLTRDHKPSSPREYSRIEQAGGLVSFDTDIPRIGALNMSHVGDLQYANLLNNESAGPSTEHAVTTASRQQSSFFSGELAITWVKLRQDRRYLLALTTDGVTNVVRVDVIGEESKNRRAKGLSPQEMADELVRQVIEEK
ncbi:LOW QUALITY PROTEIN: protein phosphatase 2C family protein [Aspergillus clavatus NRRL 1]|uniref:protein-serine/threonine phosphatase n=1 Tax=Aspergillus clavatus (strain ATCC 1007 / CBS 513.65 / DSM 816 / NCTC 3887 / NRRL 1 / QM 1276 / 107) TaxID=344612 RepID=A1CLV6_ASPCL|nr:LOW QUALITY PROTEIN: protein phosphatase 2C family protein [Aspergillus clavatus NRRL 1]EAW09085.1 protein phosphatase 2C family protein [Aspergillus clavatus NRRL 1]